jgi:hypothetical protein
LRHVNNKLLAQNYSGTYNIIEPDILRIVFTALISAVTQDRLDLIFFFELRGRIDIVPLIDILF